MTNSNFISLPIAVLTVSDTRTAADDKSGDLLANLAQAAGHTITERSIVKDNIYQIRATVSQWIWNPAVEVVLLTGGTGFFESDISPEAVSALFDKEVTGFGEMFRARSYEEIGSSTLQSRACAGIANRTFIFVLPGSPNACKTAWQLISEQLDSSKKRCNFVKVLRKNT